jgi:hypothetical protein
MTMRRSTLVLVKTLMLKALYMHHNITSTVIMDLMVKCMRHGYNIEGNA